MELKFLKDDKDVAEIEVVGEGHTLVNAIKDELCEDDKVQSAAYMVKHPLTSNPILIIRTKSGRTPKAALKNAAARLEKKTTEFEGKFKKAK